MFGDVSGGGRAGRLRLYVGLHGFSAQGDYPYLNDNGTVFNPADDVVMPRQNNDVQQGDGVVRAALTLSGRRVLSLGLIGFARDEGAAGPGRVPDRQGRGSVRCAASAICATSRATTWGRAAACRRSCSRPCSATGWTTRPTRRAWAGRR